MKITKDNYKEIVPEKEQLQLSALFEDLEDINKYTDKKLSIYWQDWHNEYSAERTDPCPDYYGCYRLMFDDIVGDFVGWEMTLDELDGALCVLYSYNYLLYGEK